MKFCFNSRSFVIQIPAVEFYNQIIRMKTQYESSKIVVFESALYRTTSTVIVLNNSVIIVDPNWLPHEIDYIRTFVTSNYPAHKQYILFTHSDYDHIIGYGAFPDATTIASKAFHENPEKSTILQQITEFDNEFYISRPYKVTFPDINIVINEDYQTITIDQTDLIFYLADGHTNDGIFVCIPSLSVWIAGDYLSNIEIPIIEHNYSAYMNTIRKAATIYEKHTDISLLITGHGDLATNRDEIKKRIELDMQYLQNLRLPTDGDEDSDAFKIIKTYSDNPNLIKAHEMNKIKVKAADITDK